MHEKALIQLGQEYPKLSKKFAELLKENDRLKAEIKKLEEVPLCADHAQAWFTARHFKEGDCWYCQATDARVKELEELFTYALGADALKYYRNQREKEQPKITVTPIPE